MRCYSVLAALAVIAVCSVATAQDQIRWQPNLETAQRLAGQTNRLVLVHFWAPWCPPCMQLEHQVFSQSQLGPALDTNFVCVKINVDEAPMTAKKLGISKIPTDLILTSSGQLVAQTPSPNTAGQYVAQMNRVADGHKRLGDRAVAQSTPASSPAESVGTTSERAPLIAASTTSAGGVYSDQSYQQYLSKHAGTAAGSGQPSPEQCNLDYQQALQGQVAAGQSSQVQTQQPLMNQFEKHAAAAAPPNVTVGSTSNNLMMDAPAGRPVAGAMQLPPGCPPLGMDGFCPVTLLQRKAWALGDRRFGAIHRGRTYLFATVENQQQFLADPDHYSPMLSGDDPVVALEARQAAPGRREHGVTYQDRIYLFSSEASLKRFWENPHRYASEVQQAMRGTTIR